MSEASCRLCGHNTVDLIDVYGEQGLAAEYARKICRYLYLLVTPDDDLPKTICWMCSQQLDSFHRFHEKINEIQQRLLGEELYPQFVIQDHHRLAEEEFHIVEQAETVPTEELVIPDGEPEVIQHQQREAASEEPEQQAEDEGECMIELIPSNQKDDSFFVVKSEPSATKLEQKDHAESQHGGEESDVQVYEIRKSTRRKRAALVAGSDVASGMDDDEEDEEEIHLKQKNVRPVRIVKQEAADIRAAARRSSARKPTRRKSSVKKEYGEESEGESGDEFPARDSGNEEWPAAETMEKFPSTILNEDGLLIVKGKRLEDMINGYYNLQCDLCKEKPIRFKELSDMFHHYKEVHSQAGYVVCCQTKFYRYPAIAMHLARHLQPDAFKCNICDYMVTRPRFLATHKQTHLPDDQKPYACDQCSKRFCWKRALIVHMNQHKAPEERTVYVCSTCGKTYDTPGGLSTHKKNVHVAPAAVKVSHVCEICANKFSTNSGLKEHMLTIHQPREQGQLQCSVCSKWLMNARCLKVHMQLHSEVDLVCDLCPYKTKKLGLLKRHNIMQHQEARPFSCEQCEGTFKHKRALTVHVKLKHSSEAKSSIGYKCNFCERKFKSSTNFYTHRKNHHPEELAAMKEKSEQEKKLQRIRAGVEPDDVPGDHESTMITTNPDGTRIITISSGAYGESQSLIVLNITDEVLTQEGSE